jgi:hypothetical protein
MGDDEQESACHTMTHMPPHPLSPLPEERGWSL